MNQNLSRKQLTKSGRKSRVRTWSSRLAQSSNSLMYVTPRLEHFVSECGHEKLDMLGYDMSWASFHVVEVMSSPKYHLKAVGYLAATQSFGPDTDVLMLTTNLLKKVRSDIFSLCILVTELRAGSSLKFQRYCHQPKWTLPYHLSRLGSRSFA